ncbi:type I restriction endonuclease [Megasphaera vaginalis (ex Bordigoni et al. 2020)]|nr:type I restriction endonuclease [Megasphaera vaginalis (ex Bordigoni et al. 2020)]
MSFEEKIHSFSARIPNLQNNISTEEATKTSLVMPFFQLLGYDVFNPEEFIPEFTADVGIKKGEKVDYAILINDEPVILIECKNINEDLTKHGSQLFRYFGTSAAKFGILTNGIIYRFYTDIEETNKMDKAPFLEINLLALKEYQIQELQKFQKENFDKNQIYDTAAELKYMSQIRQVIKDELVKPSEEFVRLILNRGIYEGMKTQAVVEKYQPLVKRAFNLVISEIINDRLKSAISKESESSAGNDSTEPQGPETPLESLPEKKIITTPEELSSFYVIKSILRTKIDASRITYKDTETYFAVNLDKKTTRWICRIYIKDKVKFIMIKNGDNAIRYDIESVDDIFDLSTQLIARLDELVK